MIELTRRAVLGGTALFLPRLAQATALDAVHRLQALEQSSGARIGLAVTDTANGDALIYRESERVLMCSTVKFLLVAATLARVDSGAEQPGQLVRYQKTDLMDYSPETTRNLGVGMSLQALAQAAITQSDNAAANLLLTRLGGPEAVTRYVRSLGDRTTRMDRREPALNSPDGDRDTTTPMAMLANMKDILLGRALKTSSAKTLSDWMVSSTTGSARLRAGLPSGWKAGDKTGSGTAGIANDIAIVWPPNRAPLLVTAYTARGSDVVLASIGRVVADAFA